MKVRIWKWWVVVVFALLTGTSLSAAEAGKGRGVALIVMDPLAKELACGCVKGYGQRDYRQLAAFLTKELGRRVAVDFTDDLELSLKALEPGQDVLVMGKNSVVEHNAARAGFQPEALARLTGTDGSTELTGFFVVRAGDPATKISDLAGRHILFGRPDSDEKHAAALAALKAAGVAEPARIESRGGCSDAALDVLDSTETPPLAAVISSCNLPLLEACGSIRPGELKVIGKTAPVPFITVFCSTTLAAETRQKVVKALVGMTKNPKLMKAMESKSGFQLVAPSKNGSPGNAAVDWPDWRGAARDGHVANLPARLPEKAQVVWKRPALNGGLAGIAVAQGRAIIADRDPGDQRDVFRCVDAATGKLIWLVDYPAPGKLDYGLSPRATPVIHEDRVYLLGALGNLHCVRLEDGKILWKRHLIKDLGGQLSAWGCCSTPLVVDDVLIVNPGGAKASVAALDCRTGKTRWTALGGGAAYSSFIHATLGGRAQVVGYDKESIGGWDPKTGRRLWTLVPPAQGDFNVPTPLVVGNQLLLSTENNGTRLYDFDAEGRIVASPRAHHAGLAPDTSTPVAVHGRLFGSHGGIHCLDLLNQLKPVWKVEDDSLGDHAALFASADRVLVVGMSGELVLLSATSGTGEVISRLRIFDESTDVYAHPALVGNRLYIRGSDCVCCVDLNGPEQ